MMQTASGILVVGHGTRDARGCAEFVQLVDRVAVDHPEWLVEGCFLEIAEPDIATGVARLAARGAQRIAVVPLLLVAAGHARRDIPRAVTAAAATFPGIEVRQSPHLGSHPAVRELAVRRCAEALAEGPAVPPERVLLIVVGRGTYDADANAELYQFARQRWELSPTGWLEVCFLAMTAPSLDETLQLAALLPFERILVAPHFLFQGELLERVHTKVAAARTAQPARVVQVAARLGADPTLAGAIVDLARSTFHA